MARRKPAHTTLDALSQATAAERGKQRDLEATLKATSLEVESTGQAVTNAYAADDAKLATQWRKKIRAAEAAVVDLQRRVEAGLRVERARQELDRFKREHARELIEEREQPARTVAADLTSSLRETLRLARAYLAERQAQDQLVTSVPGATPRADGPEGTHLWEPALHPSRAVPMRSFARTCAGGGRVGSGERRLDGSHAWPCGRRRSGVMRFTLVVTPKRSSGSSRAWDHCRLAAAWRARRHRS
jgi:hypothetical protein